MKPHYTYSFGDHQILQTPTLWSTYQHYNYMISHKGTAYIFDPGEFAPIKQTLSEHQLHLDGIYITHHHHDHTGAVAELAKEWNCPVYGFAQDQKRLPALTQTYQDKETLKIADLECQVIHCPGHTMGLCVFFFPEKKWLFVNDLVFSMGCGRVFEGTYEQMHHSLQKITHLPKDTLLFSSHEYTQSNLEFALNQLPNDAKIRAADQAIQLKHKAQQPTVPSTLGFELAHNPFLRTQDPHIRQTLHLTDAKDWEVFAELRRRKDAY
jgi:hydroxyacylglutathione hydrolase